MSRRTATLLVATLLLITMLVLSLLLTVPYTQMSPGPTVNTLGERDGKPVLQVSGHPVHHTTGHLNMVTVEVTRENYRMTLAEAITGWLSDKALTVPKETVYPPGITSKESEQQDAEQFASSQENAKLAAMHELGEPVGQQVAVALVSKGGPAAGQLDVGDVIREVDGTPVTTDAQVAKLVEAKRPGEQVRFTIVRRGATADQDVTKAQVAKAKTEQVTVTTKKMDGKTRVGIGLGIEHIFPYDIQIQLADVGGPSAGMMFTLGLIDRLGDTNLTGGAFVAGTGTIDPKGKVGEIGGVQMKTIAARRDGARYFLTPAGNCAAAASTKPSGITLVKVSTLDQALAALKDIREHKTSQLPLCTK